MTALTRNPGNTDVAVPLSRLAEMVEASKNEARALGLNACVKGHVGDSNFHENITYDKTNPEEYRKAEKAVKNMVLRALEMEGTCTGEHGIGFGKKDGLLKEVGEDTVTVMVSSCHRWPHQCLVKRSSGSNCYQKLLKNTLDPHWIM